MRPSLETEGTAMRVVMEYEESQGRQVYDVHEKNLGYDITAIQRLAINTFFDEQPCTEVNSEAIDFRAASEFFARFSRKITPSTRRSLGLLVNHTGREFPSRGAVLLFGKNRREVFPDAVSYAMLVFAGIRPPDSSTRQRLMNTFPQLLKAPWPLLSDIPCKEPRSDASGEGGTAMAETIDAIPA